MPSQLLPVLRIQFLDLLLSRDNLRSVALLKLLAHDLNRFLCGPPEQLIGIFFVGKVIDGTVSVLAWTALIAFDGVHTQRSWFHRLNKCLARLRRWDYRGRVIERL